MEERKKRVGGLQGKAWRPQDRWNLALRSRGSVSQQLLLGGIEGGDFRRGLLRESGHLKGGGDEHECAMLHHELSQVAWMRGSMDLQIVQHGV